MKKILFLLFLISQAALGQITIHVLHPWASDANLVKKPVRLLCYESWYPGISMISECNNWYTWTIAGASRTSNDHFQFALDTGNQQAAIKYPDNGLPQLIYSNIFNGQAADVNEVWIVVTDNMKSPQLLFSPPTKAKVLHIFNPWDLGVPRVQVASKSGVSMQMKADAGKCGWFRYDYFGCMDNIKIRVMNSVDSSICGMNGKGDSTYIDLTATFSNADTTWITLSTSVGQAVILQPTYPGTLKDCADIELGVDMHDIGAHPDFDRWVYLSNINCSGLQTGLVEKKLGSNGLPVRSKTAACPLAITQFDWFDTKTLVGTYTNEMCANLTFKKNDEGFYYADNDTFYPIDNFKYLDPGKTILNPNNSIVAPDANGYKDHNNHFTMIISASFEYTKGQTFYFRGDDDVWVFIDSQLVVDLGGIHPPSDGAVKLDTLGLTPGKTYDFKLFYTERNCCGSSFKMVTSLNLRTNSSFFMKTTPLKSGVLQYDMLENITKHSSSCSFTDSVISTNPAIVDFSISGPSIPQKTRLSADTSYGGIIINVGRNSITIETSKMIGLAPGDYTIYSVLLSDTTQKLTITFTIKALPPHHLDILTNDIILDQKKDAPLDTITIGLTDSLVQAYAVLRDSLGAYIRNATAPIWTSRNNSVLTVTSSSTDPSRCIITKVNTGTTWIVVNQGTLKPDSIMIVAFKALPPHHYDILTDSIVINLKKDATVDSIVIGIFDSIAKPYAVLRDSTGLYIKNASKPIWTSRNPQVVSVAQSPTDTSRCIITKVSAGVTWIVVSDPVGNLKSDSVKIVTLIKPSYPIIVSAVMLDNNADLKPDMLHITLSDTFKVNQHLDTVTVTYRNQTFVFPASATTIQGTTLLVPFTASAIDARPTGTVTIAITVDVDKKSSSCTFTDGVSPSIIAADVLENDGTQPDVLTLIFSEPVNKTTIIGKQFLLIRANSADTVALTVEKVTSTSNDSTYTVTIASTDPKTVPGDRLRLLPGSASGVVADSAKNKPHDLNISVIIGFRAGAAALSSAWYLDANADGIIDKVVICFKRKVQAAEIDSVNAQWNLRSYSARPQNAVAINDSTYSFALSAIPVVITQGEMSVSVAYKATPNVVRSCKAADSAAPVLKDTAFFHPGSPITQTTTEPDTIEVTFSEPINSGITGNTPFKLYSIWTSTPYTFPVNTTTLTNTGGSTYKILLSGTVSPATVRFPRTGDSIWIDPMAQIMDVGFTIQNNPANRRVFLKVLLKRSVQIVVSSNPFNPDTSRITTVPGVNAHGVAITIKPLGLMGDISNIAEATVVIYDALGNIVVAKTPLTKNIAENIYYFLWNGYNKNNRKVGTGTYLAIIRIADRNNSVSSEKILLGVKR